MNTKDVSIKIVSWTLGMALIGCGGSPEPEKVVIKKETISAPVQESGPAEKSSTGENPDAGNLGASHPQEAAQSQSENVAVEGSAATQTSASAPEIAPKEGFRVEKAVDGMGRGTLHYLIPQEWESATPTSSMRIAQYTLPGDAGPAELAVFGPMGGSVQMNIDRWIGQVEQPDGSSSKDKAKQEKIKGEEFEYTLLDVTGTYKGMQMPGAPAQADQENYRVLGSIVETPSGPWFLKATGPHDTLEKWLEGFKTLNSSIRIEAGQAAGGMGSFH